MTIFMLIASSGAIIRVFDDQILALKHLEAYKKNTGAYAWLDEHDVTTDLPQEV